jgi:hypothetical protein
MGAFSLYRKDYLAQQGVSFLRVENIKPESVIPTPCGSRLTNISSEIGLLAGLVGT